METPSNFPRPPTKPTGSSAMAILMIAIWEVIWGERTSIFADSRFVKTTRGYIFNGTFTNRSGGAERWQEPEKELDPTMDVAKGTWVYISPQNDLAVTGLTDLVSEVTVLAPPGIWEAAQDVPAEDSGNYNVPQIPYPGATGTPSGSPLNGDVDGSDVFWILISGAAEAGGGERFKITEVYPSDMRDYYKAHKWVGSAFDTETTYYIAKHPKHRSSLTSDTISGSAVTHTYDDNFNRTTSFGGDSQKEQLFPLPEDDAIIYCSKLITPDTTITVSEDTSHPSWFDETPRVWARKKFQE